MSLGNCPVLSPCIVWLTRVYVSVTNGVQNSFASAVGDTMVRDLSEEINKADLLCERSKVSNLSQLISAQRASIGKGAFVCARVPHHEWKKRLYFRKRYADCVNVCPVTDGLMSLLRDMGKALLALCQYDCKKAVQRLETLPPHQKDTPWPLSALARAYFEMTDYKKVRFAYLIFIIALSRMSLVFKL